LDCRTPLTVGGASIDVSYASTTGNITTNVRVQGVSNGYNQLQSGVTSPVSFTALPAGVYTITITNANATIGCELTSTYEVLPTTDYVLDVTKTSDIVCLGDATGAISFDFNSTTAYAGAYTYVVMDDNGTPADFTDDNDITGTITGADGAGTGGTAEVVTAIPASPTGRQYYVSVTMTANPFCAVRSGFFTIDAPTVALSVTGATTAISC
ncbi:hypothetical protein WH52_14700, partial [Tenacibaculum holothuriorum]